MSGPFFKVGEIWREENKHNLQIRHVAASTPRVNQGVQPWVSQRPLASEPIDLGRKKTAQPLLGIVKTSFMP